MKIEPNREWYDFDEREIGAGDPDALFIPYDDNNILHTEGDLFYDEKHYGDEGECECRNCVAERIWVENKYRIDL